MAINLADKFSSKVAERFKKNSLTGSAFGSEYEFTGVKTVKIYSVNTVPLGDYTRSGSSRYGTPNELEDSIQELTMTQDKAFTYTIDKGNDKEQLNIKSATKSLRREIDEVVTPYLDKYRFNVWTHQAGNIVKLAAAVSKSNIIEYIMDATATLDNALVPTEGRKLYVKTSVYKLLKQSTEFISIEKLGEKAVAKGEVGEVDGMPVIRVPDSYFPSGVAFFVSHKNALLAPAKLQDYKIHTDPPGINGNLVEGRILHDAFVLGTKAAALYTALESSATQASAPTLNVATSGECTIAATGGTAYYTTDGTDPRYSSTALPYSAKLTGLTAGAVVKAYNKPTSGFASAVAEATAT